MEMTKTKRREWVKTATIIFLTVLLLLTFFSNTIMNRSLPEVATEYVQSGSINAKIRGSATVTAKESYDVTLNQSRKIRSVLVRTGDKVSVGDVLFTLEEMESSELKQAQETLRDMELNYQKSLVTASNGTATDNREVDKLRQAYDDALAVFRLYSSGDPSQIALELKTEEAELQYRQQLAEEAQQDYTDASADSGYTDTMSQITALEGQIALLEDALSKNDYLLGDFRSDWELERLIEEITYAGTVTAREHEQYGLFLEYTNNDPLAMEICADVYSGAGQLQYYMQLSETSEDLSLAEEIRSAFVKVARAELLPQLKELRDTRGELETCRETASYLEQELEHCKAYAERAKQAVLDQQAVVDELRLAATAGETLISAQQALEDKVFQTNLGDTESLDLQHAREAIAAQQALVAELSADADGQEIRSDVAGVVETIHISAGNTAGAQTPVITIIEADRGYTLNIPVTAEQARQVKIGDTADITNYWSNDITAVLENIINDPQNPGRGKVLVFRLTGDGVEPGVNLTLSIGQRSANYDNLVPNSAIRSDANGSFVLVVMAKNSPLGNRYVATRADVNILASDDTTTAVSGLSGGDFVITTSSAPIEAGDQVRLVDNG